MQKSLSPVQRSDGGEEEGERWRSDGGKEEIKTEAYDRFHDIIL